MAGRSPELSVVIVTPDCYETIRKTMGHLRAQTARDRLEIVMVAPSTRQLGLRDRELLDFSRVSVAEVGEIDSIARAYAAGIRQATAPASSSTRSAPGPALRRFSRRQPVIGKVAILATGPRHRVASRHRCVSS